MNYRTPTDSSSAGNRTLFLLAGIGAILASVYWAGLTALIGIGAALGSASVFQMALPIVLIVLYALRGVQLFRGDPSAARRILWLHGAGGAIALYEVTSNVGFVQFLYGVKIAIHAFGGITAALAVRSASRVPQVIG